MSLNINIKVLEHSSHAKASEEYIHVIFNYPQDKFTWDGFIPIVYRRTGLEINYEEKDKLEEYLNRIYIELSPLNREKWIIEQKRFWREEKPKAEITKGFFDVLCSFEWKCSFCELPPSRNYARRIQDLKEFGYTIATDKNRYCPKCKCKRSHLLLLPIKRGSATGNGYETWSPELRQRIIKVLNGIDVYEKTLNKSCLPDHKFSEIRWDDTTKQENPESMTDQEIINKFQLLSNQRNQQKREVCRICYQTGKRGVIFGIPFFYKGNENWDPLIPKKGKLAEKGCEGCPWYDIQKWRDALISLINKAKC